MDIPKIHEGEYRFCLILWEHGPIAAAQLARLCQEQLGWKRTTTYTVIKRLGERGVLKNEDGMVTAPLLLWFPRTLCRHMKLENWLKRHLKAHCLLLSLLSPSIRIFLRRSLMRYSA